MAVLEEERVPTMGRVRRLIAEGKIEAAFRVAKETFQRLGTPGTNELFLEASLARAQEFIKREGWPQAASALADIQKRWPAAAGRASELARRMTVRRDGLGDLFALLQDPKSAPERRAQAELALRRELVDLASLARCEGMAPDQPLRREAAALEAAFMAVTSGAVARDALALPAVARRGPLASWRLLIQAIACYYRREDAECERLLGGIDPESPPARCARVLSAVIHNAKLPDDAPAAALLTKLQGGHSALRKVLASLDAAFAAGRVRELLQAITAAVQECRRSSPEALESLLQVLTVRWVIADLDRDRLRAACGAPAKKDAEFWRLLAQAAEKGSPPSALLYWAEYRLHALHQGLFREDPEIEAALYLHMASLLEPLTAEDCEDLRRSVAYQYRPLKMQYNDQSAAIKAVRSEAERVEAAPDWMFHPEVLFARAAEKDPHTEVFAAWLAWAKQQSEAKSLLEAAESWHAALPHDLPPLVVLARQAEERNALKKALGYLAQAERINPLHEELRQIRLRLHLGNLRRHAKGQKQHLVDEDIEMLRPLPAFNQRDGKILLAAIEWSRSLWKDRRSKEKIPQEVERALNPIGINLLFEAVGLSLFSLERRSLRALLPQVSLERVKQEESFPAIVVQSALLAEMLQASIEIPEEWAPWFEESIKRSGAQLSAMQLEVLGRQACAQQWLDIASVIADAGFKLGPASDSRFLLLRGRTLPISRRRLDCFAAAATLARRSRDTSTLEAAIELSRSDSDTFSLYPTDEVLNLSAKGLEAVLQRERDAFKPENRLKEAREAKRNGSLPSRSPKRGGRSRVGQELPDLETLFDMFSKGFLEEMEAFENRRG